MSKANGVIRMSETNEANKAAIQWAKKRATTQLTTSTIAKYWQCYKRLNKTESLAGQAKNPKTRQYDRAASKFCMAQEILLASKAEDFEMVDALWVDIKQIDAEAQQNKAKYDAGEWEGKKHYSNSKKASLKKLPEDWQEKLCDSMANHKHSLLVRILASTGCRPCEIVHGIQVQRDKEGINFRIVGAKYKKNDERGQEWRVLTIPINHHIGSTIDDGEYKVCSAESLTKSITRKANKLGYLAVSAYSFRHQMASDMKFSEYSKKEIANALGHISTETQQLYGNTGSGRMVEVKVVSSSVPRDVVKNKRKRFKSKFNLN